MLFQVMYMPGKRIIVQRDDPSLLERKSGINKKTGFTGGLALDILTYYWQKLAYQIVHKTTLWLLIVFLVTAVVAWGLSLVLYQQNARYREANFARKTAAFYAAAALTLWLFTIIFK